MLNQNAKFHELIAQLLPDNSFYAKCVAAQKFDLGDQEKMGELADAAWDSIVRPPFELCIFQFSESNSDTVHFFLVEDMSAGGIISIGIMKFSKFPSLGKWDGPFIRCIYTAKDDGEMRMGVFRDYELTDQMTQEELNEHCDKEDEYAWTLRAGKHLVHCFAVLACSNVERRDNVAPKFINAKRVQKGKTPFFSFWTVHLKGNSAAHQSRHDGSHASPRLHFRRGHIRRIGDGKTVWVTQHLVGDKSLGFAAKDYALAKSARPPQPPRTET